MPNRSPLILVILVHISFPCSAKPLWLVCSIKHTETNRQSSHRGRWLYDRIHTEIKVNCLIHLKESSVLERIGPDCNGSAVNVWFRSGHMVRLSRNVKLWVNWATRSPKRQITWAKAKICFQLYLQPLVLTPHKTIQHAVNKSVLST